MSKSPDRRRSRSASISPGKMRYSRAYHVEGGRDIEREWNGNQPMQGNQRRYPATTVDSYHINYSTQHTGHNNERMKYWKSQPQPLNSQERPSRKRYHEREAYSNFDANYNNKRYRSGELGRTRRLEAL